MGAIAKAAGLSRQALYLIFADRADLFVALLRYADGQRGLMDELARIRDAPSGVEALMAIVDMQARISPGFKPLNDAFELLRRQDPAVEKGWQDRHYHRMAGCRAVAERLEADGRLRPDLDPAVAADLIWTLTSPGTWDDLITQRGWTTDQYRDRVSALLMSALVAPG
jgi:AcrR family transcriptional regulator